MYYLVYVSVPDPDFNEAQIRNMLEISMNSNQRMNVSGCLLHYHGRFLQYLEGNQIGVIGLFDKIKADDRHSKVTVLSHGILDSKVLGGYGIIYENFSSPDHKLEYLKLLVSSFIESPQRSLDPDPASKRFWITTKKLLDSRSRKGLAASGNRPLSNLSDIRRPERN